ncbi:enoyl-CoA hydratase [Williamsia sp. SKLECPSW1]
MRSRFRSLIAATAVAAAAVTGGVVAAPAGAAPPLRDLPTFTVIGPNIGTFGDHDFCRGSVNIRLSSPKRAVTRVTITSFGFTGNGPGWAKNPRCRVHFSVNNTNVFFTLSETFFPATFGSKPGERVVRDITTGSGLRELIIGTYVPNAPVRTPQSYGTNFTYIAP